jgi:hypothetical protein
MHRSREAGRFQMDKHPSRPGDGGGGRHIYLLRFSTELRNFMIKAGEHN